MFRKFAQTALMGSAMLAGGFSVEAAAAGYMVNQQAVSYNFPAHDRLNMRAWPASHSAIQFKVKRHKVLHVERCIIKQGADWCLVRQKNKSWKKGWVNGRFIKKFGQNFATPRYDLAYGWH